MYDICNRGRDLLYPLLWTNKRTGPLSRQITGAYSLIYVYAALISNLCENCIRIVFTQLMDLRQIGFRTNIEFIFK